MDDFEAQLNEFPGADIVPAGEITDIFEQVVWPAYAHLAALGSMRQAILLIGQMGAGKSHVAGRLAQSFAGTTHHDHIDAYRPYHPRAATHLQSDPQHYTIQTQQFSHWARSMLLKRLCTAGVPLVVERVEKSYEELLAAAADITSQNYRLELSVMSVPPHVSWQGCVARYVDAEAIQPGSGRWTHRDGHNLRCSDLVSNAVVLVKSPMISGWSVETRTSRIGSSGPDRAAWPAAIASAVMDEWFRPRTPEEETAYKAEWRRINALARELPIVPPLKAEIMRRYDASRRPPPLVF